MIGLGAVYALGGAVFLAFAGVAAVERRGANALFHALIAASLLVGDRIGDTGDGVLALAIVAVAASGGMRRGALADPPRRLRGDMLFVPALLIPATTLVGTIAFKAWPGAVDPRQATLVALAAGVVVALGFCFLWLRPRLAEPFVAGARLADGVGAALVLPQMLASLGAILAMAGVGEVVGRLVAGAIPAGGLFAAVAVYAVGMAALTIVLGNAFAAFPVMVAGVGVPLLVRAHGGDAAGVAAVGMLAGFCGTLLSPMAANFNLVPAALLDLQDRHAVIRAQAPTAIVLLGVTIALLYWGAFR